MSNEKLIREKFRELYLSENKDAIIIDEFCGGSMKTRCDLGIFNINYIEMVEIKSDKDTLTRLKTQVDDYSKYSNFIYIVLDIKFYKKLDDIFDMIDIPSKIIFYKDDIFYDTAMNEIKSLNIFDFYFYRCFDYSKYNVFDLLWRDEKLQLLSFLKGRSKAKNLNEAIESIYTVNEVKSYSYEILYNRMQNKIISESKIIDFGKVSNIKNKDIKQELFNDYLLQ